MKLLFLSCHSIEEYDELILFRELGIDVFSHGGYMDQSDPGDPKRPALPPELAQPRDEELIKLAQMYPKEALGKELIDKFDVILVMHIPHWITKNWEVLKNKIVIWRTTGQSITANENELRPFRQQGMKIIRYSPRERTIMNFIGEDALIRFYKDPLEWQGWNGKKRQVITVGQNMKNRFPHCNFPLFEQATRRFHRKLFGPDNENSRIKGGLIPYEQLHHELRNNRVYFYTGTHPACYTLNFMEAFMTGTPIVAIGEQHGNMAIGTQRTYEIPDIIQNGVNGYISDDVRTLRKYIKSLMRHYRLAEAISQAGREKAIELFGKTKIKEQWKQFFAQL